MHSKMSEIVMSVLLFAPAKKGDGSNDLRDDDGHGNVDGDS